jgi:hypothetical protein
LHIYANHLEQVEELLKREPLPLPVLELVDAENLKGLEGLLRFKYENLNLVGYQPHEKNRRARRRLEIEKEQNRQKYIQNNLYHNVPDVLKIIVVSNVKHREREICDKIFTAKIQRKKICPQINTDG